MGPMKRLAVVCGSLFFVSLGVSLFADLSQMPTTLPDSFLKNIRGAEGYLDHGDCTIKGTFKDPCEECTFFSPTLSKNCDALPGGALNTNCDVYTSQTDCVRCECQTLVACQGDAYDYSDGVCKTGKTKTKACVRKYNNCKNAECWVETICPI